jgi:mRNA guanylyltransferase
VKSVVRFEDKMIRFVTFFNFAVSKYSGSFRFNLVNYTKCEVIFQMSSLAKIAKAIRAEKVHPELRQRFQDDICKLLDWTGICHQSGGARQTFPGSQPVSLEMKHLNELKKHPYVACEKSDGERFMLWIYEGSTYIFGRDFEIYKVDVMFPHVDGRAHHNTLLDGEIVLDSPRATSSTSDPASPEGSPPSKRYKMSLKPKGTYRYLVYDAVVVLSEKVADKHLLKRLAIAYEKVILPKNKTFAPSEFEPFQLYLKDFFEVWQSRAVMAFSERLPHECDGLIFTPVRKPYTPGTFRFLLKWKPPHLNSIDFKLHLIWHGRTKFHGRLLWADEGKLDMKSPQVEWMAKAGAFYESNKEKLHSFNSMIVECRWNKNLKTLRPMKTQKRTTPHGQEITVREVEVKKYSDDCDETQGGWEILRVRGDKKLPNDVKTVQRVRQTIKENLDIDALDSHLRELRTKSKTGARQFTVNSIAAAQPMDTF